MIFSSGRVGPHHINRRHKVRTLKPIAPFTRDPMQAARTAFDRDTSQAIPPQKLKTLRQILTPYHLRPEAKFLNGDYLNSGTTQRRHIHATRILHIGKEANRLEEQIILGINDEANPDYGVSPNQSEAMVEELGR